MARPPKGEKLVENVEGSDEAKRRARVIVETLAGKKRVAEACEELGVSESHFHELRAQFLAGAVAGLEPGRPGRPATPKEISEATVESLKQEITELRIDLQAARIREELAVAMPHVLKPRSGKKTTRRGSSQELFGPKSGT